MKKTGTAKNRRAEKLAKIPKDDRWSHVEHGSKLHSDAAGFKETVYHSFALKADPRHAPGTPQKWIDHGYNKAVEMFRVRFLDAYRRKDGDFFKALGDVLDREKPSRSEWTPLEKLIFTQCEIARDLGERLPSAAQFLRAWQIRCGIVPTRKDDLQMLWDTFIGGPLPKYRPRSAIETALQKYLGAPDRADRAAAKIQIKQIQDAAKNVGFTLPKQTTRKCLPAGMCVGIDWLTRPRRGGDSD